MNLNKLKEAEANFFTFYPKGFEDEGLLPIIKRHNTEGIGKSVRELFAPERFRNPDEICGSFAKIVSKSTLVSLFEKPKVRDMVKNSPTYEFYERYTRILSDMKAGVSPLIGRDNAGFSGFLMMAMK